MSDRLAQLAALFIAPPTSATRIAAGDAAERPYGPPVIEWRPPVDVPRSPASPPAVPVTPSTGAMHERSEGAAPAPPAQRPDRTAAVMGVGPDTLGLAAGLAGELRVRSGARTALLLAWSPARPAPAPLPAWPATRRLAAGFAPSHQVAARGRLVLLQLPGEPEAAASVAAELSAAAGVPTVLALCGPRSPAFDGLLRSRDVIIVSEAADLPGGLAELAARELRRLNRHVLVESGHGGGARRLLACVGLGRARSLGARLDSAAA